MKYVAATLVAAVVLELVGSGFLFSG